MDYQNSSEDTISLILKMIDDFKDMIKQLPQLLEKLTKSIPKESIKIVVNYIDDEPDYTVLPNLRKMIDKCDINNQCFKRNRGLPMKFELVKDIKYKDIKCIFYYNNVLKGIDVETQVLGKLHNGFYFKIKELDRVCGMECSRFDCCGNGTIYLAETLEELLIGWNCKYMWQSSDEWMELTTELLKKQGKPIPTMPVIKCDDFKNEYRPPEYEVIYATCEDLAAEDRTLAMAMFPKVFEKIKHRS